MNEYELSLIHSNQRFLIQELQSRGVTCELLVAEMEIIQASYQGHTELLVDRDSSIAPYSVNLICSDKYLTKLLLNRAGLDTTKGEQFFPDQKADALRFAESMEGPVVVKPSRGSHGMLCSTDLNGPEAVSAAIDAVLLQRGPQRAFLVEEQVRGSEYRIFITKNHQAAVLERIPATVIGDGMHSIAELAQLETERRMSPRTNCLCPVVVDREVERYLALRFLTLQDVPASKQSVQLRGASNIALGGSCTDRTAETHPGYLFAAQEVLKAFPGLAYAGIDIITPAIDAPPCSVTWGILEVNANPGLHMHIRPANGSSQPVARYLADLIFPETLQ